MSWADGVWEVMKRRIPDLLGCGARVGSGFKRFWPTCRVGVGASEEGSSVHDPEFDRKFDRMFEIIDGETGGVALCMVASKRERCRKPALRE